MKFSATESELGSPCGSNHTAEPLFRPEILASISGQAFGAIRLTQPISRWIISAVSLAIGAALVFFIAFAGVEKKTTITGVTVPVGGTITVSSTAPGTLKRIYVKENDRVERGQSLFEIETGRQAEQGEIALLVDQQIRTRLNALSVEKSSRLKQIEEKTRVTESRISNMLAEIEQLDAEMALAQQRRDLAKKSAERFKSLEKTGFVSSFQSQQKQEDLIDVTARINALARSKSQLQDALLGLREDRSSLKNDLVNILAQLEREEGSLRQELIENEGRQLLIIRAPRSGIVTTITNSTGQSIGAGQVLATIVPADSSQNSSLEVHLYAPSRTVGFIEPGQRVYIRYQSFPYQKFGLHEGKIVAISATPFAPNELQGNLAGTILSNVRRSVGASEDEALYRIVVKLAEQNIMVYGKPQRIKPGMTLEADVVQEKRKIWEWMFEPLLTMRYNMH